MQAYPMFARKLSPITQASIGIKVDFPINITRLNDFLMHVREKVLLHRHDQLVGITTAPPIANVIAFPNGRLQLLLLHEVPHEEVHVSPQASSTLGADGEVAVSQNPAGEQHHCKADMPDNVSGQGLLLQRPG